MYPRSDCQLDSTRWISQGLSLHPCWEHQAWRPRFTRSAPFVLGFPTMFVFLCKCRVNLKVRLAFSNARRGRVKFAYHTWFVIDCLVSFVGARHQEAGFDCSGLSSAMLGRECKGRVSQAVAERRFRWSEATCLSRARVWAGATCWLYFRGRFGGHLMGSITHEIMKDTSPIFLLHVEGIVLQWSSASSSSPKVTNRLLPKCSFAARLVCIAGPPTCGWQRPIWAQSGASATRGISSLDSIPRRRPKRTRSTPSTVHPRPWMDASRGESDQLHIDFLFLFGLKGGCPTRG